MDLANVRLQVMVPARLEETVYEQLRRWRL